MQFLRSLVLPASIVTLLVHTHSIQASHHKHGHKHAHDKHEHKEHARDKHGHAHQRQHVHGRGHMDIALIGAQLMIEFRLPALNMVGFERAAVSVQQKQAVATALKKLQAHDKIVTLPRAAACKLASPPTVGRKHHGDAKQHKHADFHATYKFQCVSPQQLTSIETNIFKIGKGIELIEARWVTAKAQLRRELTPKRRIFVRKDAS